MICKDPQADTKKRVAEQGIKEVTKVISVTKLRKKYKPYEAKRNLCSQYEMFMAEASVLPLLPPILGKVFFRHKKQPIAVNLKQKNIAREIATARDSTYLFIPAGPSWYALFVFLTPVFLFCSFLFVGNDGFLTPTEITQPCGVIFYHAFL